MDENTAPTDTNTPMYPPSYSSSLQNDPAKVIPDQQEALTGVRDHESILLQSNTSAMGPPTALASYTPMPQPGMMPGPQPITHQPNPNFTGPIPTNSNPTMPSLSWMPAPSPGVAKADCSPGLECLSQLHQVTIAPHVEAQTC